MSSQRDYLLRDLYGGDYEYHQDYHRHNSNWRRSAEIFVPVVLLLFGLIYTGFYAWNFTLLPLPELLWNCLVYVTPSRILDMIENDPTASAVEDKPLRNIPRTHAAKSVTMRRLFGFDKAGSIMGTMETVAQAGRRRLSSLSGNIVIEGEDGRPPGLGNWDNSCYQNSVLQGLASLDSLSDYLTEPEILKEGADISENTEMKMANSLRNLIAKLKDPSNNGKRIWTPATLKSMSSWQQQDAQEYFSKVLDEIDKEITKVVVTRKSFHGLGSTSYADQMPGGVVETANADSALETSIRNPLEGLLAQRVGCTRCGYSEGLSLIPFNCITIPVGRAWSYDILDCLDEYTKLEAIEGVQCGRCTLLKTQRLLSIILERIQDSPGDNQVRITTLKRLQDITEVLEDDDYDDKTLTQKCNLPPKNRLSTIKSRQAVIARPPKSLALHVNRSLFDERTGELKKNCAEVRFPKILDLGPWCLGSAGSANDANLEEWILDPEQTMIAGSKRYCRIQGPKYELRAVVTHYGRHENGHYICYRKHPVFNQLGEIDLEADHWWRLSDDDVMKVSENAVLAQGGVFMLFYDCIEPASLTFRRPPVPELAPPTETSAEVALASIIPLPADSDDDFDASDIDDQDSFQQSREQSITTTISDYGDEASEKEQEYHPTKAILIPPWTQNRGVYREEETDKGGLRHAGSMVMV